MGQATSLVQSLQALTHATASVGDSDIANLRKQVKACAKARDVLTACRNSTDDSAGQLAQELESALCALKGAVDSLASSRGDFAATLQALWTDEALTIPSTLRKVLSEVMFEGARGACDMSVKSVRYVEAVEACPSIFHHYKATRCKHFKTCSSKIQSSGSSISISGISISISVIIVSLHHAGGHVRASVLFEHCAMNKLLGDMTAPMLDFLGACSTMASTSLQDQPFLQACCTMQNVLEKLASQCQYMVEHGEEKADSDVKVLEAGSSAAARFRQNFNHAVESMLAKLVQEKGAKAAADLLSTDLKLPLHLGQCKAVLLQAEVLEKLGAEEDLPPLKSDVDKFYSDLTGKTKKLMTVWSLDRNLMMKFVPSAVSDCSAFEKKVVPPLQKLAADNEQICAAKTELLSKYRRGFLCMDSVAYSLAMVYTSGEFELFRFSIIIMIMPNYAAQIMPQESACYILHNQDASVGLIACFIACKL